MKSRKLIVIVGPTASGKTDLAVNLAKKISAKGGPGPETHRPLVEASGWKGIEIINADSRSIYQGMIIGTGSPTKEEQKDVPHHLFNFLKPDRDFSLALYQKLVNENLKEIWSRGKIPFLVGGTGLYVDSIVYEYEIPTAKPDQKLREKLEKKSNQELLQQLKQLDPESAAIIDPKNKRRLIRALEVCLQTGKPFSSLKTKGKLSKDILMIGLDVPREILYQIINSRVEEWLKRGFLKEVETLTKKYPLSLPSLSGIGYKQFGKYLKGEISFEEAKEKFKQGDRNLAKRQFTWFRKNKDIQWVKAENLSRAQKQAEKLIKDFLK